MPQTIPLGKGLSDALPTGDATLGRVKITDGTDVADVLDLTTYNPLAVAVVDANGDQVTAFGGGTQYTEDAAAAANPVGNAFIVVREDARAGSLTTTDGDNVALRGNNSGELYVKHTDSIAVTGTFWQATQPVSLASVPSHAVTNAGTFVVQVDGAALTSLQLIDDPILADDVAFTPATTKVMMVGFEADETSTDSVDEGDAGAARITLDRKIIATLYPHTAGGLTTAMFTGSDGSSILTNAAQVIKGSAGQVYGYYIYNPNSSATFVHFYNTAAASVSVGTTNPLFSLTIPATSAANLALPYGILFTNAGFSIAATTTAGGNTAPSTGLDAIVWYA